MDASNNYGIAPLASVERTHIEYAMHATKRNLRLAARLLGIGRTTLYRKLRQYRAEKQA